MTHRQSFESTMVAAVLDELGSDAVPESMVCRRGVYSEYPIAIVAGVVGDVSGSLIMAFRPDAPGALGRPDLMDFAEQVIERGQTRLGGAGLTVAFAPPTMIQGDDVRVSVEGAETSNVYPFAFAGTALELIVAIVATR